MGENLKRSIDAGRRGSPAVCGNCSTTYFIELSRYFKATLSTTPVVVRILLQVVQRSEVVDKLAIGKADVMLYLTRTITEIDTTTG